MFAPLEGMESDMRRASSADDLEALLGGAYTQDAQVLSCSVSVDRGSPIR